MGRKKDKTKERRTKPRCLKPLSADDCSDNDSVLNDAASVTSAFSSTSTKCDHEGSASGRNSPDYGVNEDDDSATVVEDDQTDDWASKLGNLLEDLESTKSSKDRIRLYNQLTKALQTRYCGEEYLENRKFALQLAIEHGLKRGVDLEIGAAAHVFSLTLITMARTLYSESLFETLYVYLRRQLVDPTAQPFNRSRCATTLSVGCFITDYGLEKNAELMDQLLMISFSSVSGYPDANQLTAVNSMKANCLEMFAFLFTISEDGFEIIMPQMNQLLKCLDSNSLELRVAAGECIALIYEYCVEEGEDLRLFDIPKISEKLAALANDSQKSRSKKELRTQRTNFRQILRTIQDTDGSEFYGPETIKFGHEKLLIDSWKLKRYYDTFCSVLGPGMNIHLAQNPLLREIFDLGPVLLDTTSVSKIIKIESKQMNNANRKIREMHRSKMRGKRGRMVEY